MSEKREYDIIIIGGGAAGLMAAAGAGETLQGRGRILVLEKMPRPGRKIMITGKGRCNFTNLKVWNEFSTHIHPKSPFLKPSFYNLSSEKTIEYFRGHGMESEVERGDRAFPKTHLSSTVVDTLVKAATDAGAEILCNKEVKTITDNFTISCQDGSTYDCKKLIICTGGLSYPKTGSSGDGYKWAAQLGHTIRPLFPSLTALVPKGYKTEGGKGHIERSTPLSDNGKYLHGNQLKNIGFTVMIDGNVAEEEFGDIDFTDGGLEGPVGFKVSRKCVSAILNGSKVKVIIDLKPAVESEDLFKRIKSLWNEIAKDRRSQNKNYKERFRILLTKLLPMQMVDAFMKMNPGIDHNSLAKALKWWEMDIIGYVGYERCVITAGGVNLTELSPKTMESKQTKNLYFAGEILDLDADTGGYNLQVAFSTGYMAGTAAAKDLI